MTLKQKVDKSFLRSNVAQKVQFGNHAISSIEVTPDLFPGLPFSLVAMKAANNLLSDTAAAAEGGSHNSIAARNNAEKNWIDVWSKTADYVSLIAAGNADIITLAGFTPTSAESVPSTKPGPAVLEAMTQHEGGVAEIRIALPTEGKVAAYLSTAMPDYVNATVAADGTITLALPGGDHILLKCDTHPTTTMGGLPAGKMMKLIVQPVNIKGTGGLSTPKTFMPQP